MKKQLSGMEQGEHILPLSDPLSEEYLNPLYEKYWEDPSFKIKKKDGKNFLDIQYALIQEVVSGDHTYTPILHSEERGKKVIGFTVINRPEVVLVDATYTEPEVLTQIFIEHLMNGSADSKKQVVQYIGRRDYYLAS